MDLIQYLGFMNSGYPTAIMLGMSMLLIVVFELSVMARLIYWGFKPLYEMEHKKVDLKIPEKV